MTSNNHQPAQRQDARGLRDLESWHRDKAVQDSIVESWLCVDCGMNTHPGCPSGPETRIDLALKGVSETSFDRETEVYSVKDAIWKQAGMRPWSGCLCIGCLEKRIGRQLRPKDFSSHDKKVWAEMLCTERLLNRRGFATVTVQTRDGPKEVVCDIGVSPLIAGSFMETEPADFTARDAP
jgi:hypothetical protein